MTHLDPTRHGRLTHTRISVADAVAFLRQCGTVARIATRARTAVAITNSRNTVVAVAAISTSRTPGGRTADAMIAWTNPTARMRTMLLAAAYQRAHAMGFHLMLVHGDDRLEPYRVDVMYPLTAPRRTHPATGIQITRHLWGRPDNRGVGR